MTAASKQDPSLSLLGTLTASLLLSFSPADVTSVSGKTVCTTALRKVTSLSRRGYLQGSPTAAQLVADLVSLFTTNDLTTTTTTTANRRLSAYSAYDVDTAASWLVEGVQLGMASGEAPVSLVTSNIQVEVLNKLITSTANSVFTTPATDVQLAYGAIQPRITLGPNGLASCSLSGQYAQFSLLQWSVNPYIGSTLVKSQLLRFTPVTQSTPQISSNARSRKYGLSYSLPGIPAYYIALQFSSMANFNFSAVPKNGTTATSMGPTNYTVPACTVYNGAAYVPCKGCNISSYTNYNVTYSCYDITQLCPSSGSRRYLRGEEHDSTGTKILNHREGSAIDGEEVADIYDIDDDTSKRILTGDDDASTHIVPSLSYGVLIQSVEAELSSVLSSNPFLLDPAHASVILTFMGCLCGFMGIMIIRFLHLDYNERLYKIYVKSCAVANAIKVLEDDINCGGDGSNLRATLKRNYESVKSFSDFLSFSNSLKRDAITVSSSRTTDIGGAFSLNLSASEMLDSNSLDYDETDEAYACDGDDFGYDSIYNNDGIQKVSESVKIIRKKLVSNNLENSKNDKNGLIRDSSISKHFDNKSVVSEFFFKLFPGNSIFSKKNNVAEIVCSHHNYFTMFYTSTVAYSRTIRFIDLISLILTSLFADTVFFGIFYPVSSHCTLMKDKVRSTDYSGTST